MSENPLRRIRLADRVTSWIGSPSSIVLHTLFFVGIFGLKWFGVGTETILLILTTAVSLEAIYLAIFIQMTVNRHAASLAEVEENIDEIAEDVEEISEDIDEIAEDVEDISEDIDRVEDEVGDISEDVDKIQEEDAEDNKYEAATRASLDKIENVLQKLILEIEEIKKRG